MSCGSLVCEYPDTRRVSYGEGACFIPVCVTCHRFVKADESVTFDGNGQPKGSNATCAKCGRTEMHWEGWI